MTSKEVERKIKVVKEDIRGAWAGMDGAKAKASKAKAAGDEGEWTAWLEKQCHLYKTLDCLETKEQRLLDEKRAEEEALQQGAALNRPCVTGSPPRISPKMKAKLMEALQGLMDIVARIPRGKDSQEHELPERGRKRGREESETAGDASENGVESVLADLTPEELWQAKEETYHRQLVHALHQPIMYVALGLPGPPTSIALHTNGDRERNTAHLGSRAR